MGQGRTWMEDNSGTPGAKGISSAFNTGYWQAVLTGRC